MKEEELKKVTVFDLIKTEKTNCIPMVGWHEQSAKIKHDGKEYNLSIAGGCSEIWLTEVHDGGFERQCKIKVGSLLPIMIEYLNKVNYEKK